jgi:ankyrin repeat protein
MCAAVAVIGSNSDISSDGDSKDRATHALLAAAVAGLVPDCIALLKHTRDAYRPDVNKKHRHGRDALWWAATRKHTRVCATLLQHGANVNSQTNRGRTALMECVDAENATLLPLLLEAKAQPNMQDELGMSALMLAQTGSACKALLDAKASVSLRSKAGETALHYATKEYADCDVVEDLLCANAQLNARATKTGNTPLHCAVQGCNHTPFLALMRAGADVSAVNHAGESVLCCAVQRKRYRMARAIADRLNEPMHAFTRQARIARDKHVAGHWTDSPLFDFHLVREITQWVSYSAEGAHHTQNVPLNVLSSLPW